eukprot:354069-Chlamydomonas_euryale.AAC.21
MDQDNVTRRPSWKSELGESQSGTILMFGQSGVKAAAITCHMCYGRQAAGGRRQSKVSAPCIKRAWILLVGLVSRCRPWLLTSHKFLGFLGIGRTGLIFIPRGLHGHADAVCGISRIPGLCRL